MAPGYVEYGPMALTPVTITHVAYAYANTLYNNPRYIPCNPESKKDRIKRIAKERMLASRKLFNQKTQSIIQVKQFCKPQHRLGYLKR